MRGAIITRTGDFRQGVAVAGDALWVESEAAEDGRVVTGVPPFAGTMPGAQLYVDDAARTSAGGVRRAAEGAVDRRGAPSLRGGTRGRRRVRGR